MIETRRLKNVVIFIQTVLSFVLSRKIILTIRIFFLINYLVYRTFYFLESSYKKLYPEAALNRCSHKTGVLKICNKSRGEHPCRIAISMMLQNIFIEITLRHGCSPVNLLHFFRTTFCQNTWRAISVNHTIPVLVIDLILAK